MKKTITIILCIAILAAAIVGCGGKTDESAGGDTDDNAVLDALESIPAEIENGANFYGIDFDAAFKTFKPDTIMINAGDYTVTWEELYFYMHGNILNIISNVGEIPSWSEILHEDVSFADAVMDFSLENAMMYKAVEYGAKLAGISPGPEDLDQMQKDFEEAAAEYGGEDKFLEMLRETNGIYTRNMFDYLVRTGFLANLYFRTVYGENGELLSDEEVAEHTKQDGYLRAKHILRLKPEEGEDTARQEIDDILAQLNNYEGDDFGAFFDELMRENTEDNLASYPNGYLFQYGDMVPSFYEACVALELGNYSGIVESEYGYHILYRLPIDYDEVPFAYFRQNDYTTLRNIAALDMFDSTLYGWLDALNPEFTAEFESIDIATVFALDN